MRKCWFADNTKRMAGEIPKIKPLNLPELHNARLRGWQRTAELKKHTVNIELQFCTKAATRWQSLLSRLLGQLIDTGTFKTRERAFFVNLKQTNRFIYKPKCQLSKETKNSNWAIWKKSDERSMLGGRLDSEGYFAAEFTALSNPTRSRNNKYVMIIYCLT